MEVIVLLLHLLEIIYNNVHNKMHQVNVLNVQIKLIIMYLMVDVVLMVLFMMVLVVLLLIKLIIQIVINFLLNV